MNEEKEILITNLKDKVKYLISLYERTREENRQLLIEKNQLLRQSKQKEAEIETLNQKYSNLLIASTLVNGNDTHESKIKINKIVREIDKCIALLNKLD